MQDSRDQAIDHSSSLNREKRTKFPKKKNNYKMIATPPNNPATTMKSPYTWPISRALARGDMPVLELAVDVADAVAATVVHCPKPVQTTLLPPVVVAVLLPLTVDEAVPTARVEVALPLKGSWAPHGCCCTQAAWQVESPWQLFWHWVLNSVHSK
jgi:hypothetical protein